MMAEGAETEVLQPVVNASRDLGQACAKPARFPGLLRRGIDVLKAVHFVGFKCETHDFSLKRKTEPTPDRE